MAAFVVMQKTGPSGDVEDIVAVRDGFFWFAFLLPVVWLLWHRLWIEAALAFASVMLLTELGAWLGLGPFGAILSLLVQIYIGLEGGVLRVRALTRRGWREWGVVEATGVDDAEQRFAGEQAVDEPPADSETARFVSTIGRPIQIPMPGSIGLVSYPARS